MSLSNFDPNPGPGKRTKILMTVLAILVFTSPITIPVYNSLNAENTETFLLKDYRASTSTQMTVRDSSPRLRKKILALYIIQKNPGAEFTNMATADRLTRQISFGGLDKLLGSLFPLQVNQEQMISMQTCLNNLKNLPKEGDLAELDKPGYNYTLNLAGGNLNGRLKNALLPDFCTEFPE